MTKAIRRARAKSPPIRISDTDYDVIASLAMGLEIRSPALAQMLFQEIDRAKVYPAGKLPSDVVALGAQVSFVDDTRDTVHRVQLVMPNEADVDNGKVSILTPVGAGLIGLKAGQSIDWPYSDGRTRVLKILDVTQSPQPSA